MTEYNILRLYLKHKCHVCHCPLSICADSFNLCTSDNCKKDMQILIKSHEYQNQGWMISNSSNMEDLYFQVSKIENELAKQQWLNVRFANL